MTRKKKEPKTSASINEPELAEAEASGGEEVAAAVEILPADYEVEAPVPVDVEVSAEEAEPHTAPAFLPTRYDALESYLREIRAYPMLTKEQEFETALVYHKSKDVQAAYKLVTSNLWLVVKIARDYERAARTLLDIVQEGNIGLMEAVKNFDPHRGVRFPSYAVWWIKAYIVRYLIANWRLVKIGTTQAQRKLFFNLQKEKEKLEREGFYPEPKLIAERLQVRESDVVEMEQRLLGSDMSVDAPLVEDGDSSLLNVLPASSETAEDFVSKKQLATLLQDSLDVFEKSLNPKELAILRERLLGEEKATLDELSQKLKVSRERIRQLENRIKEKLKVFLQKRLGNEVDNLDY